MDDLATLTAQPQILRVGGKEYKIYPLTLADFGKLQEWVDSQFPNPFEEVRKAINGGDFNYAQQKFMLELALEKATKARRKIGQPEVDEILMTMEGYKQIILLSIKKGKPDFTEEEATELFNNMSLVDIVQLQTATNLDMVISDPKAEVPLNKVPPSKMSGSAEPRRTRRKKR